MSQRTQGDFADVNPSWTRNTKDFRGRALEEGFVVEGVTPRGVLWLTKHAYDNHRHVFLHNAMLHAADEVELDSLLTCLQKELNLA